MTLENPVTPRRVFGGREGGGSRFEIRAAEELSFWQKAFSKFSLRKPPDDLPWRCSCLRDDAIDGIGVGSVSYPPTVCSRPAIKRWRSCWHASKSCRFLSTISITPGIGSQ